MSSKIHLILIYGKSGDSTDGRGGDDHHGQVILGRQPHKKQFGGRPPEFPQPHYKKAFLYVDLG